MSLPLGPYPFQLLLRNKLQLRIYVQCFILGTWHGNNNNNKKTNKLFGAYYLHDTVLNALNILSLLILLRTLYKWTHYYPHLWRSAYPGPYHQGVFCNPMGQVYMSIINQLEIGPSKRGTLQSETLWIWGLTTWLEFRLCPFLVMWLFVSSIQSFRFSICKFGFIIISYKFVVNMTW